MQSCKLLAVWNHFHIVKTFKYICEERQISSKPMSAILGIIFYVEGSIFANIITVFGATAFQLSCLPYGKSCAVNSFKYSVCLYKENDNNDNNEMKCS